LFFLHADSMLLPGALNRINEMLSANAEIIGGNFRLVFDGDTPFSRWLTGLYAWIRSIALYYGDSGIFVRRSVYEALGGFRPLPLMEDLDFVRRLERFGRTYCITDPPLITSSRRFERRHPLQIVYGWIRLHVRKSQWKARSSQSGQVPAAKTGRCTRSMSRRATACCLESGQD
jgi:hypothetical protein